MEGHRFLKKKLEVQILAALTLRIPAQLKGADLSFVPLSLPHTHGPTPQPQQPGGPRGASTILAGESALPRKAGARLLSLLPMLNEAQHSPKEK